MDPEKGTPEVKKFIAAYKKEYGKDPENAFAALGYDAIYLLADAIKRAGSPDPAKITAALNQTRGLKTVTGTITFAGSGVPQKAVTVIGVKDLKLNLAASIAPSYVPRP